MFWTAAKFTVNFVLVTLMALHAPWLGMLIGLLGIGLGCMLGKNGVVFIAGGAGLVVAWLWAFVFPLIPIVLYVAGQALAAAVQAHARRPKVAGFTQ